MRGVTEHLYTATRTVAALEFLAYSPPTITELAERLQVHPRTARRLMRQLAADKWVVRGDDRRYRLTPRLVAVARQELARAEPD
jgi:DNA-binding IclR family transcriptional regulator